MDERMKQRLSIDRPMTAISIRMPEDVIDDLKEVAPARGFSGYQALMRAYIGAGLREDLSRLRRSPAEAVTASLRRHGVDEATIQEVVREAGLRRA